MPDSYQACNFTITNTFCLVAKQITENNREDLISRYFLTHFDATSIPVNPIKSLLHLTFILSFYKSFHHSIMILICMKDLIINLIKKVCRYLSLQIIYRSKSNLFSFFLFCLIRSKLVYQNDQSIIKMIAKLLAFMELITELLDLHCLQFSFVAFILH